MTFDEVRAMTRQSYALVSYRGILGFGLLVSAYVSFPAHFWFCTFGILLLSHSMEAIGVATSMQAKSIAESVRRTALVAGNAAQLASERDYYGDEFWQEIWRRVDADSPTDPGAPSWWKSCLLVIGRILLKMLGDAVGVVAALVLANLIAG